MRGETPFGGRSSVLLTEGGALALPPRNFRSAPEHPFAQRSRRPKFSGGNGRTDAQKAGIRYEKRAKEYLRTIFPDAALGPWFEFYDDQGAIRFCQPDAVVVAGKVGVIFECKIRHVADAWWQLKHLYRPVVRAALGLERIGLVEITRSFDPSVVTPEKIELLEDISTAPIDVYSWEGKVKAFLLRL